MVFVWRQMNLLCKHGIKGPSSFPLKIKLLETSKNKSHACAVFIVSSNHQYSTLQNGKKLTTTHLLDDRLAIASIASRYLSTDNVADKVQGVQGQAESTASFVTIETPGRAATKVSPEVIPAEPVASSTGTPITDHAETFLSGGSLSEDLAPTLGDTLSSVVENVEIPLSAVGLGGWTPVGIVQRSIELLHVGLDMPWWVAIVVATFIARTLMFPLLVKAQQNAVKLSNHMPQLQVLQGKFNRARRNGNALEASRYGLEINDFMKNHNINPLKNAVIPLCQAPVFISFFLGLRSMARLPVESLKTGGIGWITDLTIPDPYYITPLLTCGTLYIVIKVGAESGVKLENMKLARYLLTALPIIIFPFTIHFPAAVLCYWCASNAFTLGAVSLLRVERVRAALNIPKRKPVEPEFAAQKKGFVQGVKEAFEDQKMLNAMMDRSRLDEVRFKRAGTGPVPRTYAYDPTKPGAAAAAAARKVQAKDYKP